MLAWDGTRKSVFHFSSLGETTASLIFFLFRQAGDIVAQLKAGIAMRATVIRNGKETEIEARELVAGDIVRPLAPDKEISS